jgi:hypothetical protein
MRRNRTSAARYANGEASIDDIDSLPASGPIFPEASQVDFLGRFQGPKITKTPYFIGAG